MLGKTAGGLFWMFRYLERSENTARLIEAGFRIALTRPDAAHDEWGVVVDTAGVRDAYSEKYDTFDAHNVVDFLLRDTANPSSVMSAIEAARNNARLVRTALTREVWEAVNESWMTIKEALKRPVRDADLPGVLGLIRQQSALVSGTMQSTMLRNDIFDFARIGTHLERADNTARILDVKYYVLLPSVTQIGSSLDNVQWETILRALAGQRSYRWLHGDDLTPRGIAQFLMLDQRMPRSLKFSTMKVADNMAFLEREYGTRHPCHDQVDALLDMLTKNDIETIFEHGLHEFITEFIAGNAALAAQIETDFRFNG